MYQLCYSIFKMGSQRLRDPRPPSLSVINPSSQVLQSVVSLALLPHGSWRIQYSANHFCCILYSTREVTIYEKHCCGDPGLSQLSLQDRSSGDKKKKKNRWKNRLDQTQLKSQFSNGISIWHRSSSAVLGCGKGFFINNSLEPFLADWMKSSSPLMLRYYSY